MKRILYIISLCVLASNVISCSKYFEPPMVSNSYSEEDILDDITRVQGMLIPAYDGLPSVAEIEMDYYSDNALYRGSSYERYYSGWTSEYSPNSTLWNTSISMIYRINDYLLNGFDVDYYLSADQSIDSSAISEIYQNRMRCEAYGLRAYYQWILLKNFAGPTDSGEFLSYPILDTTFDQLEDPNAIPRASYEDGFNRILDDIDLAWEYLPKRYEGSDPWDSADYNLGRVTREMLMALKARMYLFAASEAYKQVTMEEAAEVAYDAIVYVVGSESLRTLTGFNRRYSDCDDVDILWRSDHAYSTTLESNHFPPSMWGNGYCNPTEDYVRAYPDSKGFPIDESSIYDPNNPYENRCRRLEFHVFLNGENQLTDSYYNQDDEIDSYVGGDDAHGGIFILGTRTGYYMKRHLSGQVDRTPRNSNAWSDRKFKRFFTLPMLYMDFAEAVVDAYGLDAKGSGMQFDAIDALELVRERVSNFNDDYADEYLRPVAANDLTKLKALIRNERRILNSFDGERLYDMMRWKLPEEQMTKADGISITKEADGSFTYEYVPVVTTKRFDERMYYFPIPRTEILKSDALVQNQGWE